MLQYADKEASYEIFPGVTLLKEATNEERKAKELNLQELPADSKLRATKLVDLLVDSASRFISSRSLKIKMPTDIANGAGRGFEEESKTLLYQLCLL